MLDKTGSGAESFTHLVHSVLPAFILLLLLLLPLFIDDVLFLAFGAH